jgi:hypothetical protein
MATLIRHYRIEVICGLFCLLTGCSHPTSVMDYSKLFKPYPDPEKFQVTQIACSDISTPESRATVRAVKEKPYADVYAMSNEATDIVKKVAAQGNAYAIFFFGYGRHERIFTDYSELAHNNREPVDYPAKAKAQEVEALTYIFIAEYFDTANKQDVLGLIADIERNKSDLTIPTSWIKEARANVQAWKDHCGIE